MPLKPHISPKETAGWGRKERERARHFIQNASKIAHSYDSQVNSDRIRNSSQDSLGFSFTSRVGHCEKYYQEIGFIIPGFPII